jgi:hypothetical protein
MPIRIGSVFVCMLLAIGIARGPVHGMTILVAFGAVCLSVAVLSYRAEVNETEVSIRYAPFFTRNTPVRDITHLVEGKTLILMTPTSRIPLWGLSDTARESLFQILPRHIDFEPSRSGRPSDSAASIRKHRRWTIVAGIGFLVTAVLVVPFFKGNALHDYWDRAGQYLLLLCLLFFIALIFEAGFTWVLWSTKRDIDRIENRHARRPS